MRHAPSRPGTREAPTIDSLHALDKYPFFFLCIVSPLGPGDTSCPIRIVAANDERFGRGCLALEFLSLSGKQTTEMANMRVGHGWAVGNLRYRRLCHGEAPSLVL